MEITAKMVKELREKTGAGMMDCKSALKESGGDFEKAATVLREKGIAKAASKGGVNSRWSGRGDLNSGPPEPHSAEVEYPGFPRR